MKKRLLALLLALVLCLTACGTTPDGPTPPDVDGTPPQEAPPETPLPEDAIKPLELPQQLPSITGRDGLEPYGDYWYDAAISADLSADPALAYSLIISDATQFPGPEKLPEGYDPYALLAWGMDPGLNVDILHAHGFTGKGAVIAYVDQCVQPHEQYDGENIHIANQEDSNSMHGPAVLSLLAGRDIGVAPEAEVYYHGFVPSMEASQLSEAEALYQIIEQNENLPEGEKITMVGFSDNIDPSENYEQEFRDAAAACEEAGIMVWFCGEYNPATFLPYSDKNDNRNLVIDQWMDPRFADEDVFIPTGGRTTAATMGGASYIYWSTGGLSWAMPYALGLYAIAIEIDPTLTQDELRTLLKESAYDVRGMRLVNPVGFVSAVLRRVDRDEEADAMLKEAQERVANGYTYAVVDNSFFTDYQTQQTITGYLSALTDTTVLSVKTETATGKAALQTAILEDAAQRDGFVKEVIFFGDATQLAPEEEAGYPVTVFPDLAALPERRLPVAGPELAERAVAFRELAEKAAADREASLIKIDGTPRELPFDFPEEQEGWEIHGLTAQALEGGMVCFTLEYTVPEGFSRLVFDPPNGDRISLGDFPLTSGDRESITFEISREDFLLTDGFSISFFDNETETPFFLCPIWSKITWPE